MLEFFQTEGLDSESADAIAKVFATKVTTDLKATAGVDNGEGNNEFSPESEEIMMDLFACAKEGKSTIFMRETKPKSQHAYIFQKSLGLVHRTTVFTSR